MSNAASLTSGRRGPVLLSTELTLLLTLLREASESDAPMSLLSSSSSSLLNAGRSGVVLFLFLPFDAAIALFAGSGVSVFTLFAGGTGDDLAEDRSDSLKRSAGGRRAGCEGRCGVGAGFFCSTRIVSFLMDGFFAPAFLLLNIVGYRALRSCMIC